MNVVQWAVLIVWMAFTASLWRASGKVKRDLTTLGRVYATAGLSAVAFVFLLGAAWVGRGFAVLFRALGS